MTTLSQMLADDNRRNLEWARGIIRRRSSMWQWADDRQDVIALVEDGKILVHEGMIWLVKGDRLAKLNKRKAVICPNAELWPGVFTSDGGAWIPENDCRKCPFYRKAGRYRYSTCEWARQERTGGKSAEQVAAQETLGALREAINETAEIMQEATR